MIAGAVGHYRGETAFAVGASTTFSEARGVLKAGATLDEHGRGDFAAGAGFSFRAGAGAGDIAGSARRIVPVSRAPGAMRSARSARPRPRQSRP